MSIKTQSVYTKKRLIKFNNYVVKSKKLLWIMMSVSTVLIIACLIFQACTGGIADTVKYSAMFLGFLDVFYLFISFILPHITLPKSKTLNAKIQCTFNEYGFDLRVVCKNFDETSAVRYPTLVKIVKNGDDIYLFIASNQAFITSIEGLADEDVATLKELLGNAINKKNFIWR